MALEFKLPDIGEGTVEGEIVRWLVEVGDSVEADQPVVEVMTDKATVELTAPRAGKILEKRFNAGAVVEVGAVIYLLGGDGEEAPAKGAPKAAAPAPAPAPSGGGNGAEQAESAPPAAAPSPVRAPLPSPAPLPSAPADGRKPLATPATRRVARELGIDLGSVRGTGPAGRITIEDVKHAASAGAVGGAPAAASAPAAAPSAAPAPAVVQSDGGPVEKVPFRGVRKATAAAMVKSKYTATHFTYVDEVDVTELVRLRKAEKDRLAADGVKISYLPFIMRAACLALKKHPMLNSQLDEAAQEILVKKYYHLGISIQAENGLSVGVVRDVDRLSIVELANEMNRVIGAVRSRSARPEDLRGSTFTITSAGNIGGLLATPIINYPEVAIMGVHRIKRRPWVTVGADGREAIGIRDIMYLSLSVDHRVVDGAGAAEYLNDVIALLESPSRLLLGA